MDGAPAGVAGATDEPIRVLVRVRPPLPIDGPGTQAPMQIIDGDTVRMSRKERAVTVRFDAALDGRCAAALATPAAGARRRAAHPPCVLHRRLSASPRPRAAHRPPPHPPRAHSVTQAGVYEHVRPAVEAALSGLNATIMAYGQTGSGKSHTLFGGLNPNDPPLRCAPSECVAMCMDV
jgi:hypothetical protein